GERDLVVLDRVVLADRMLGGQRSGIALVLGDTDREGGALLLDLGEPLRVIGDGGNAVLNELGHTVLTTRHDNTSNSWIGGRALILFRELPLRNEAAGPRKLE